MDCCSHTIDLGCVGFCGTIETGLTAPATGTYVISLIGAGGVASFDFTSGEEIRFTNPFNEDSVAVFQILRNGVVVENGIYDCYEVKVTAGISLAAATNEGILNTFNTKLNGVLINSFTSSDTTVNVNVYP